MSGLFFELLHKHGSSRNDIAGQEAFGLSSPMAAVKKEIQRRGPRNRARLVVAPAADVEQKRVR